MDEYEELSLDNETMATTHDAVVLTVGAVRFRGREVLEKAHFRVSIDEQLALNRKISASTFRWWMDQSRKARDSVIKGEPEVHISTGRAILRDMGTKVRRVWARPGMFDLPMLRHLFGQDLWDDAPAKYPCHGYQKENDLGTLVQEFDPQRKLADQFVGEAHNALDDALHHQTWLCNIRDELHRRGAYDPQQYSGTQIWTCKVGECGSDLLPDQADWPMREAIRRMYAQLIGREPNFIFSGWGGMLTRSERGVVEDRKDGDVQA
jgi:hypothetical protein